MSNCEHEWEILLEVPEIDNFGDRCLSVDKQCKKCKLIIHEKIYKDESVLK